MTEVVKRSFVISCFSVFGLRGKKKSEVFTKIGSLFFV